METGDTLGESLRKEFCEEALSSLEASREEKVRISKQVQDFFSKGEEVRSPKKW